MKNQWLVCMTTFACLGVLLGACSSKDVYEFGNDLGRGIGDCDAKITADERRECAEGRDVSYEQYVRDRELAKQGQDQP